MTMPRKQTQRDLRRLEKAEKAAQLEKVIFLYSFFNHFLSPLSYSNLYMLPCRILKMN